MHCFILLLLLGRTTGNNNAYENGTESHLNPMSKQGSDFFLNNKDFFTKDDMVVESIDFDSSPFLTQLRSLLPILKNSPCTDGVLCHKECSQYKVMDRTGCCRCTCARGYLLDSDNMTCNMAAWAEWSSWSSCIKSDWGGLQQRQRICMSDGKIANGRCIAEGSQSRTCNKPTRKDFRIRKNIRYLTDEDVHDLLQAFAKFKADKSRNGYMSIVKWHGWPYRCPWYKDYLRYNNGHCSWHHHPLFLTWHRLITVQAETAFNRYLKNKSLGLPYWDWTEKYWQNLPDLLRLPIFFDPILQKNITNPFFKTLIPDHPKYRNKTLFNYRHVDTRGTGNYKYLLRAVLRALNMPNYASFDTTMENAHDQIHDCFCPTYTAETTRDCQYSMLVTDFSAFDPAFFLHHSQIDRIYALYREIHEQVGNQDWTKTNFVGSYQVTRKTLSSDIAESFDFPLSPFCNSTMNPNNVTLNHGVWTVRNSYHHQQLFGYKYDTFDFGEKSWFDILADVKENLDSPLYGLKIPFISHAAPSLGFLTKKNTDMDANAKSGCEPA